MMLLPFFNRPNLLVWAEVDREQVHRRIELGLPE
jgi:deoxyadenosine/deoxycytidine kinase